MRRARRPARLLLSLTVAVAAVSACSADAAGDGDRSARSFAVITHGAAGDAFWDVVQRGAEDAGRTLGVEVDYESDPEPQGQAQLVDAAVNQRVDGIVVSLADPDALEGTIEAAVAAGIPVVTINSGGARSAAFGAIGHVGQDEFLAGKAAGRRLAADGVRTVLCVLHEPGNVGLEQRCAGAGQALGRPVLRLQVGIDDLQDTQSTIASALQRDPGIDGVLTLNAAVGVVAEAAVADARVRAQVATFDVNGDVVRGIEDGGISFAVDQQPYEQGYLPIVMLHLHERTGGTLGGGRPVLTGPSIVDAGNVGEVADRIAGGTR